MALKPSAKTETRPATPRPAEGEGVAPKSGIESSEGKDEKKED